MKRVIEAVKDLFISTALAGDDAGEAATFALENVGWSTALQMPEPQRQDIVEEYLEPVCTSAGQYGSNAHMIGEAILSAKDQFRWNLWGFEGSGERLDPDIEAFQNKFAWCSLIGSHGPLKSDKIAAGFSLQLPDVYYPPHAHEAVETYWIIGGDSDWKVDVEPWFGVESGSIIHHESWARHAMQTNYSALLTVWLWTSHLNSDVVIVRG